MNEGNQRSEPRIPERAKPATVLVADDEKNVRLTVTEALESEGVRILTAVSGEDALQRLTDEDVDVLLLDLAMPGVNGIEVLREVVRDARHVAVVVISAHGTVARAVEAMKLGAIEFLEKPFSPEELRHAVRRALDRKSDTIVEPPAEEGGARGTPTEC